MSTLRRYTQLWGNPNHMASIAKALRVAHPPEKLHILCAKRNSGSFTYDGIELGGERVCLEIQEELQAVERQGSKITKLSLVGYSLGGLVARYAIGLLYAKGILDDLECMTFTAFASPFLGVRTPLHGWTNHLWNVLGARTLSTSGRQLFTIDKFRDTDRPLLAVLADRNSIFYKGLAKFHRRVLYCNIVNDRAAVYYTSAISKTNPYLDLTKVRVNYVKGYGDIILDPAHPVEHIPPHSWKRDTLSERCQKWLRHAPITLALAICIPIGIVAFLVNSVFQTVRSAKRIALHEKGKAGINIADYRVPVLLNEIRGAFEDAYEELNSSQHQQYLGLSDDDGSDPGVASSSTADEGHEEKARAKRASDRNILRLERKQSQPSQPTLALAPCHFEMISALDSLGWRKYPVWIHRDRRSHAAMIVRADKETFREGHVVLKHWLKEEFLI